PRCEESAPLGLGPALLSVAVARLLLPFFGARSALGPAVEVRASLGRRRGKSPGRSTSLDSSLLRKIGSAYNTYRGQLLDLAAHSQDLIGDAGPRQESLRKIAAARPEYVFTPLTVAYLESAFLAELGGSGPARR
ncbi:MAG TPA: hypothetical protein VFS00_15630, partial [Polyangiaceae bacterium]|nr:hypothetical protein [Polyangiaceae bacterium]